MINKFRKLVCLKAQMFGRLEFLLRIIFAFFATILCILMIIIASITSTCRHSPNFCPRLFEYLSFIAFWSVLYSFV